MSDSSCDIYQERKKLGKHLAPEILRAINEDMENTVFSFIPNTAEICYYGLMMRLGPRRSRIFRMLSRMVVPRTMESSMMTSVSNPRRIVP